jgi:anti-sigma regulatory factor (Ser/Thr protein kinase)
MAGKKTKTVSRKTNSFRLKLPANSENLDIIRKFIGGIAENSGFSEEEIYQIELAVDEACANVIRHAYVEKNTKDKNIYVIVKTKPALIEISIADTGIGFNPDEIQTPNMDEYLKKMKPGGLGLHLIKTLMDEVDFQINPGVRNEVKMIKHLPS